MTHNEYGVITSVSYVIAAAVSVVGIGPSRPAGRPGSRSVSRPTPDPDGES